MDITNLETLITSLNNKVDALIAIILCIFIIWFFFKDDKK